MLATEVNEWGLTIYSTADGTQPSVSFGTALTPAQNAYGTYVTLISGANLTDDCYELVLCVNTIGLNGAARDGMVSIGLDSAGGTSFTSICDLVCGPASMMQGTSSGGGASGGLGVWFRFPLFIKNGTSIGVAGSVNSATLTAFNAFCRAKCRPTRPDLIYAGTYIDQYGVTVSTSSGTAVTPGTASEGAYASIGTLTRPIRWVEFGYGVNDSTMTNACLDVDVAIGDASNKRNVITNAHIFTSSSETIAKPAHGQYCRGATNDIIYARSQCSQTADSANSVAVYCVGG